MEHQHESDGPLPWPPGDGQVMDIVQLVRAHYQAVYRYAFRLAGNEADAEDLTQQTFLIAQDRLGQVRNGERVLSWLFAVLRSCFLKSRRRLRPIAAVNLELNVEEIPEHRWTESAIDREELQGALNDLPEEFRLVVLMFYFEEMSYQDIAKQLELPIGTVMSRLSRAKGRLRQRLFRSYGDDFGGGDDAEPADGRKPTRDPAASLPFHRL